VETVPQFVDINIYVLAHQYNMALLFLQPKHVILCILYWPAATL